MDPATLSAAIPSHQFFHRAAAQSRLETLKRGTEEHSQLQSALLKAKGIVEISLPTITYKVDTVPPEDRLLGGFGSAEHMSIGKEVKLQGLKENTPLLVKGIIPIHFHDIIPLAGDFYAVYGAAVSLPGGTLAQKNERFIQSFNTLIQADNDEIRRVHLEVGLEYRAVSHSSLPHHCYSHGMIEKNNAIKKIKSDIDKLLIDNSDHFSRNAEEVYSIGHALALQEARKAGATGDIEGLKRAYAMDAYACHFLTDLFAAGHIRNQRGDLEIFLVKVGFSTDMAKALAGLLTGAQHEKDGHEGLNVCNKKGDHWRAYGDGDFFSPQNKENKERVIAATQASVNEIYEAYLNFHVEKPSAMEELIPHAEPFLNPLPLYEVKEGSLILYQGSEQVKIEGKTDYLTKGISQALRYLPEEYINGFIKGYINPLNSLEIPPVLDKIFIPQMERFTGTIWHMVGIATYHQVRQENLQLHAKIDEVATILDATYKNSVKILQQIQSMNSALNQLMWTSLFSEIQEPLALIKDMTHQHKLHKMTLSPSQLQQAQDKLWSAYIRMSRVFCDGTTAGGIIILEAYRDMLAKNPLSSKDPTEIKIAVTLWFRQMLDYQIQAFSLYATLKVMRNDHQNLQQQISEFESSLGKQLETNRDHIDGTLVCEHQSYISLQIEKKKLVRVANARLAIKEF